jgi:hypothetical protein
MNDDEVLLDQRKRTVGGGRKYLVRQPRSLKGFAKTKVAKGDGADLPTVDMRTTLGRRYREVCIALINDAGGLDRISAATLSLIRRFAASTVLAEQIEARAVAGEVVKVEEHAQLSSTLVRIARLIGTARVPKELPALDDYLRTLARSNGDATHAPPIEGESHDITVDADAWSDN